jgi:hypothetical protein
VLTRPQVQVVPSLALTVMDFPALTAWITPRSNASVLVPLRACTVNCPSTPRSRKNAKMRRRARRQWAAPMPTRRASLRSPARCAARPARRALVQAEPFIAIPARAPAAAAPAPPVSVAPAAVSAPGAEASLSVSLSRAPSRCVEAAGPACPAAASPEAVDDCPASLIPAMVPPPASRTATSTPAVQCSAMR